MDFGNLIRDAISKLSGKIVDETAVKSLVKDIQKALLIADVNVNIVRDISKRIEERALKEKPPAGITMNEHTVKVVYDELVKIMGEGKKLELKKQKIMLCGLYGSGKTSTVGKLARYFMKKGLTVSAICCDTSRPAAYEQLKQISENVGFEFYGEKNSPPWEIVKNGLKKVKGDVIIVDTSGRSALDKDLIEELKRVNEELKPDEKILVVSADIGQIAKKQAEEFDKAIGITGIIITKMDGSGKGGGALSSCAATNSKILFIGTGEKMDDLEEFNPEKYVGRLLGFPDFESLIKKMKEVSEGEKIEIKEELDIESFYEQLKNVRKIGPFKSIAQSIGLINLPKEIIEESEENMKKYESIILSMTKDERKNPELVIKNNKRIERIAKGSGVKREDVKKLLDNFLKMKKLYERMKKDRNLQRTLEKFMKGGKFG
jgi:signal recognition particle subunit SRP54